MTEIKVSQRAREAAADRFEAAFGPNDLSCEMRQGLHDCDPMTQAFARFEQAIRADERERAVKVVEGEARYAPNAFGSLINGAAFRIAAAIRAQGGEA